VLVFVIFFLLQRQDLRDRFIRLAGARDLRRTTLALDDAGHRLSSYLLTQTGINTSVGVLVGTGLWLIGVPNPALWGILTMLLRFVPYIGPVVAAAFPAALAVAVDPGWAMLFWVVGLFLVVELTTGYCDRTLALRPQHRAFGRRGAGRRRFLDIALGAGRAAIVDAADHVPGCTRPACRASAVS